MSKRFIDTGLFDDPWFMDLSKDGKLLWIYMITRCDHAGIIELNKRLVKFQTEIKDLDTVIQELSNRLVTLDQGFTTFFIPKFITFQYPNFPNSNVNQQQGAIKQLEKYGLFEDGKLKMNCSSRVHQELPNSYVNGNGNGNDNGIGNGNVKKEKPKNEKNHVAEYVTLTPLEHGTLIQEFGEDGAIEIINKLNYHKGAKGVVYKSDYMAIRKWVINAVFKDHNDLQNGKSNRTGKQPATSFAEIDRAVDLAFGNIPVSEPATSNT